MKQQKIILVHLTSSLQQGGAETVLYQLLTHLEPAQYEHHVIYIHDGPFREKIAALGISTYQLTGVFSPYDPLCFIRLVCLLKKIRPHLIQSLLWYAHILGSCAARLLNIPIIYAAHALPAHEGKLRTLISRLLPIKPTHYIAVSPAVAASLHTQVRVASTHIHVIPNGVTMPKPSHGKKKLQHERTFIIGAVGRFVPVKNFDLLITAVAQLRARYPSLKLLLLGQGPEEAALRTLAEKYMVTDSVHFIMHQSAHDYYPLFDCFAQPSRYEGMSLALLEALSHEIPVIVTGQHKHHDVITHQQTGIIIEPQSLEQLVEALEFYLRHETQRHAYAAAGRRLIENKFTLHHTVQQYDRLFKKYAQTDGTAHVRQ